MDAYVAMGCRPTWTCAPYQLPERPGARRTRRLGRVQRHRVLQLGARRPDGRGTATSSTSPPRSPGACPSRACTATRSGWRASRSASRGSGTAPRLGCPVPRAGTSDRTRGRIGRPRDRRPAAGHVGGPSEGARGGRILVGVGGDVPRRRSHAGGADPRGRHGRRDRSGDRGDGSVAARRPRRARDREGRGPARRRLRRDAACVALRARTAGRAARRREAERGALGEHRTRDPRRGRTPGRVGGAGTRGGPHRDGHLHVPDADDRRRRRAGDDRLGQVGVVRAGEPRRRGGVREPRGVRALGARGPCGPRPGRCGPMAEARTLVAGTPRARRSCWTSR